MIIKFIQLILIIVLFQIQWLQRLSEAKRASDRSILIERDLISSKREISALQKAVADIKNALVQERKINLKLQTENDKLRVSILQTSEVFRPYVTELFWNIKEGLITFLLFSLNTQMVNRVGVVSSS